MESSSSKVWLFRTITVLLPFIILLLLELVLRGVGFGQSIPLFINNPQAPSYLLPKPDVVSRYFSEPSAGPDVTIETNFFLAEKPKDGLRLFVQGGSTAAGFPYGFGASIAGMLDYRLKQSYPNREVEVINTALSAVNSYTLLDFADEIIEQKPDAVLIYAGHNEFLGIMGVGSTYSAYSSRGANLMFLKLKNLRLFQLMQSAYDGLTSANNDIKNSADRQSRTVMAKVAKHRNIDINNPLFSAGLEQFNGNMILLLDKYKRAGIPVFLSTIASNLADQPPFESTDIEDEFLPMLRKSPEQWSAIEQSIIEKQATKYSSAQAYFLLGKAQLSQKQFSKAKLNFELARQHDLLRFRAPLEMNQIIRQLAADENVTLVDAEHNLTKVAEHGIIGRSLMLEHLHPTIKGYFEISNTFYETLVASPQLPKVVNKVGRFAAQSELPIFDAEIYKGHAAIAGLIADYPFTSEPTSKRLPPVTNAAERMGLKMVQNKISWLDVAQAELELANKNKQPKQLAKAAKLMSDAMPYNAEFAFQAGSALIYSKQSAQAIRYLSRSLKHKPNYINAMLAMAHANAELKNLKQAKHWLLEVKKIDPNNKVVADNLNELEKALNANK